MTGEEGDHEAEEEEEEEEEMVDGEVRPSLGACEEAGGGELSSLDEISPYSTVNSSDWRRYSDLISQRIRSLSLSLSQSRRQQQR